MVTSICIVHRSCTRSRFLPFLLARLVSVNTESTHHYFTQGSWYTGVRLYDKTDPVRWAPMQISHLPSDAIQRPWWKVLREVAAA